MAAYKQLAIGVLNLDTGAVILPGGAGWVDYLAWLAAGGVIEPADPVDATPPSAEIAAALAESSACRALAETLRGNSLIQQLRTRTPSEVDDWINNNVVDLASAKVVLRILAYVVALLARERLKQ